MTLPLNDWIMTFAQMGIGCGADVSFDQAGHYNVKTKVVAGETKLIDSFLYDVK